MIKRTDKTSYPLESYDTAFLIKSNRKDKRDFFRIEKHPNLKKKCISSSKSMKKIILEKFEDIKVKLKMLN